MLDIVILICAVIFQILAVVLAVQLIKIAGKAYFWILILMVLFFMMIKKIIPLYHSAFTMSLHSVDLENEVVGLVISIFIFLGIGWGKQMFVARKRAEDEARDSAKRIHYLSKFADDFIILLDDKFRFIEVNDRMLDFYGYTREEVIGMHASQLRVPEAKGSFVNHIEQANVTGKIFFQTIHQCKDGKKFPVEISLRAVDIEGKRFYQAVIRDITERKKMEEALRSSEDRFSKIFHANPGSACIVRAADLKVVEVNDVFCGLTGFSREELIGYRVEEVGILTSEVSETLYALLIEERSLRDYVVPYMTKAGEERYVLASFEQITLEGALHFYMASLDVTERKRTEEALRNSEERFSKVFQSSPVALSICRADNWKIVEVNESGCLQTGYSREEIIGRTGFELGTVNFEDWNNFMSNAKGRGALLNFEQRFMTKAGEKKYGLVFFQPINLQKEPHYIMTVIDITERKRAEEALRQSEEEKTILNEVANIFLTVTDEAMYWDVMKVIQKVTKSTYGIFGFIGERGELDIPSWSREVWKECQVPDKIMVFLPESWGESLWGKAIREKKSFYSDGPFHTPEGHITIDCFLTVPIIFGNQTIGLLSVGNKAGCYGEEDRNLLERIAGNIAPILNARLERDRLEDKRKKAEETLKNSEERFSKAFHTSPSTTTISRLADHKLVAVNDVFCTLTGYIRDEAIGHTASELGIIPFDEIKNFEIKLKKNEKISNVEFPYITKTGQKRYALAFFEPTVLDGVPHYIVSSIDITERRKAEELLKKSEEDNKRLARENEIIAAIGRVVSSTLDIKKVFPNLFEKAQELISFDSLIVTIINQRDKMGTVAYTAGLTIPDRAQGKVFPLEGSLTEMVLQSRSAVFMDLRDEKNVNEEFPAFRVWFKAGLRTMVGTPLFSGNEVLGSLFFGSLMPGAYSDADFDLLEKIGNQIAGAIANAQLFAEHERLEKERMNLQEQLQQSQKMEAIGRLAGGVAHDFNNLLTVITVQSQLSLRMLSEGDPLKEKLKDIAQAADRAGNLTMQLLAFSRRQLLEMKVVKPNVILKDMEKMLKRVIGEDIEMKFAMPDDLGMIKIDPGQLEQVVINLAVNSKDAMPQGGKLLFETANIEFDDMTTQLNGGMIPGAYVMFSITDTGIGMSEELMVKIFEPFFTTKEKGKGTGLGLSTVYGIVKQSGGEISVCSEPGKGTTFKIYFPRVFKTQDVVRKEEGSEDIPRGKETILLVEDDRMLRKTAVEILKKQGYEVMVAMEGGEALLIFEREKNKIDLVLTDIVMPHMNGAELVNRLKQIRKDLKVLYMTGYTDEAVLQSGIKDGKINLIHKPFTVEGLAQKIREVLDAVA